MPVNGGERRWQELGLKAEAGAELLLFVVPAADQNWLHLQQSPGKPFRSAAPEADFFGAGQVLLLTGPIATFKELETDFASRRQAKAASVEE